VPLKVLLARDHLPGGRAGLFPILATGRAGLKLARTNELD
jgi:hypothetical protein